MQAHNTSDPQNPWRVLRATTGLTLREVARRTGISSGLLSIYERGVQPKSEDAAKLRAFYLGEVAP